MKKNRILAVLLALLLALSCTPSILATESDGFLDQFEITVPQLPSVGKTPADVLPPTPTGTGRYVTFNNGNSNLSFYPDFDPVLYRTDGKRMADNEKFTAGQKVNFCFSVHLPRGYDIKNSLISSDPSGSVKLDLPVLINGTASDDTFIAYLPDEGRITVNAWYTVPLPRTVDTFDVLGLVLPEEGMTVKTSLKNVSVRGLEAYKPTWEDVENNFAIMDPGDKFEAGKQYHFIVSFKDEEVTYSLDNNGNAALTPLLDGKPCPDAVIAGGKPTNSYPTFNLRYTVPASKPAGDLLEAIYITGLELPADGLTAYASLTSCVAAGMTVTSLSWEEDTEDGHLIKMENTDRFQAGKTYIFRIRMDIGDRQMDVKSDPSPFTWVNAKVYVNGSLEYTGDLKSSGTGVLTPDGDTVVEYMNKYTCPQAVQPSASDFADVPLDAYYKDAVDWAVGKSITNGTSATTFSPLGEVTRAEAVTFLWRAKGCPEPKTASSPFTDVQDSGSWFYKAVLWAVEENITNGTSATTFTPKGKVTRGQMITFLYRTLGEPGKTGQGNWYEDAERWAGGNRFTDGTATAYTTSGACPRSDVVFYLWKALK